MNERADRDAEAQKISAEIVMDWIERHPDREPDTDALVRAVYAEFIRRGWATAPLTTQQKRIITTVQNARSSAEASAPSNLYPTIAQSLKRFHINPQTAIAALNDAPPTPEVISTIDILTAVLAVDPQDIPTQGKPETLTIKGSNFAIPSQADYKDTFKPIPKPHTEEEPIADNGILQLEANSGDKIELSKYGLKINGELADIVSIGNKITANPTFDKPLLMALYTLRFQDAEQRKLLNGENLKVGTYTEFTITPNSFSTFLERSYGTLSHAGQARNLVAEITELEKLFAVYKGSYYALLKIAQIDGDSISIVTPLFDTIIRDNLLQSKTVRGKTKLLPTHNKLFHASAAKRNQSAFDMAVYLVNAMQRRGNKPDKDCNRVIYHCAIRTLIEESPSLQKQLSDTDTAANRNNVLRRAFIALYDILKRDTDCYTYFSELEITQTIPTNRTVETAKITVSWNPPKGGKSKEKTDTSTK